MAILFLIGAGILIDAYLDLKSIRMELEELNKTVEREARAKTREREARATSLYQGGAKRDAKVND